MTVRFYVRDGDAVGDLDAARARSPDHKVDFWRPTAGDAIPPGAEGNSYRVFAAMHRLRLFKNRDYAAVTLTREGDAPDHLASIFPGFFRFPFMAPNDLQIGLTSTRPGARGLGLAQRAVLETVSAFAAPERRFWYLTEADNVASCAVIERTGFRIAGTGERRARFGVRMLGYFAMDT